MTLRKLRYYALYLLYLLVFLSVVDLLAYLRYKKKAVPADFATVPLPVLIQKVGRLHNDKLSSFSNFPRKKPPGAVRLGCFGDSFTYGDEVGRSHDYPSFLQQLFHRANQGNVQVINFGMNWWGFHQSFILWDQLGRRYGLDYILLGPQCFQIDRDNTFNHAYPEVVALQRDFPEYSDCWREQEVISYFHSRYVLADTGVKLIDPLGATDKQRVSNYWRWLPRRQYLLYDRIAPPFLNAPLNCLGRANQLKTNPFYYRDDFNGEMQAIYAALLTQMASETPHVVLGHYDPEIVALGQSVNRPNLRAGQVYIPSDFPYVTLGGHSTSFANRLIAQQMFDIIQGRRVSDLEMLTFDDVDNYAAANRPSAGPAPQGDFVSFEEDPVGRFGDPFGRETVSKGLIGIRNASRRSVLNASFLPVEFDVADDMLVTLSPKRSDVSGRVVLGRIKKIHPKLNFGLFEAGDSDCRVERLVKSGRAVGLKAILTPPFKTEGGREVDADWVYSRRRGLTVFVEDKELLVAKSVGRSKEQLAITFGRTHGGFVVLTVPEDTYVDVTGLKEKGDVYLTSDTGSIQTRIKWASWRKTRRRIRF